MRRGNNSAKKRAFTLIELLVTMGILAAVASVTYTNANSYYAQARDFRRKEDLKKIELAMEHYYDAAGTYPKEPPACNQSFAYNGTILMGLFPCDPKTGQPYVYLTDVLVGYQWYKVYTKLERENDHAIAIVGCENGCGPECWYNFGVASSNISITTCVWPMDQTPTPTVTVSPSPLPSVTPTPTPEEGDEKYVCAPGGGQEGSCEVFDDPDRSLCPVVYPNDPTCQNQCWRDEKRCKNSSGKHKP